MKTEAVAWSGDMQNARKAAVEAEQELHKQAIT